VKLGTIRTAGATVAVRVDGDTCEVLDATDVGAVLRRAGWRSWAADGGAGGTGERRPVEGLDLAPVVPRPGKVVCVGMNYGPHIAEMGREAPEHPTLFAKFAGALIGAHDDIVLPAVSDEVDWEAELAVVVGRVVRHADAEAAAAAIAGYTVCNDVSVRDWQGRSLQWLQGKTFEATTPLGPWLVTPDEAGGPSRAISCEVAGEVVQRADTAELVFDPVSLVAYLSTILTLEPGDVIATGTPGGVGVARTPPRFLREGDEVVTRIEGVGELRNRCRRERRG
jgi:acylpyruvate hydrolase